MRDDFWMGEGLMMNMNITLTSRNFGENVYHNLLKVQSLSLSVGFVVNGRTMKQ